MKANRTPPSIGRHKEGRLGPAGCEAVRRFAPAPKRGNIPVHDFVVALMPAQLQLQALGMCPCICQPPCGAADETKVCGALICCSEHETKPYQSTVTSRDQRYGWNTSQSASRQRRPIRQHIRHFMTIYEKPVHDQIGGDRAVKLVDMGSVDEHYGIRSRWSALRLPATGSAPD